MNHQEALAIVKANNIDLSKKTVRLCRQFKQGAYTLEQLLWDLKSYMSPIDVWEDDSIERWINDCALWSYHAAQDSNMAYKAIANLVLLEAFTSL